MSKEVTVVDRGLKAIFRRSKRFDGASVTVGIQGTEANAEVETEGEGTFNMASLAAVHEFGSQDGRIPQRSFIRGTIDREKALIFKLLKTAAKRGLVNGSLEKNLGVVGEKVVAEMVRTIDQSIGLKANAPSTVAAKGSSTPLLNVGTLQRSITHKVHGA